MLMDGERESSGGPDFSREIETKVDVTDVLDCFPNSSPNSGPQTLLGVPRRRIQFVQIMRSHPIRTLVQRIHKIQAGICIES